jgi:hypothetical protein
MDTNRPDIEPELVHKLYVVVRGDLPPGLRTAQAGHAIAEMCLHHDERSWKWHLHDDGNYLIVLETACEWDLVEFEQYIARHDIPTVMFHEPDLDFAPTAFAALPTPEQNDLFNGLPLALSKPFWHNRLRRFLRIRPDFI